MKVLIVGSGYMAEEYVKVFNQIKLDFVLVGRSSDKVNNLKNKYPGIIIYDGGLTHFLDNFLTLYSFEAAINCVSVENLFATTNELIDYGFKKILVEKPVCLSFKQLQVLNLTCISSNVTLLVGYNRRFYDSVHSLLTLTDLDGGITSMHFEFTEWIHKVVPEDYSQEALNRWVISNSSHVIDLAFYLIGSPISLYPVVCGRGEISWHSTASTFVGSGLSSRGIPFTYHSNWMSAGRWGIEVMTKKGKYYLKPLEGLYFQERGSLEVIEIFAEQAGILKAGLLNQLTAFLKDEVSDKFIDIKKYIQIFESFQTIAGYKDN